MTKKWSSHPAFAVALGFAVLSVAILWQAQGLILGGHGHGHGGGEGMTHDEFVDATRAFNKAYAYKDGVRPPLPAVDTSSGEHALHGEGDGDGHDDHAPAVDVYLMAFQWDFSPGTIYLKAGQDYRFRMMAMDVHHGFAIAFDDGSRIWRLPPDVLVDATLSFDTPGQYLIYCTFFCGGLHERMTATIVVEA